MTTYPEIEPEARQRLDEFAAETGTTPPEHVLIDECGDGGTFTTEFLAYCRNTGLSLDWVWSGEGNKSVVWEDRVATGAPMNCPTAPVVAGPQAEGRIIELFRRHQKLIDAAERHPWTKEELENADCDKILDQLFYDEINRIESEMMATPCNTPADFAAKVIVATSRGGIIPDWDEGDLFIEARALIG